MRSAASLSAVPWFPDSFHMIILRQNAHKEGSARNVVLLQLSTKWKCTCVRFRHVRMGLNILQLS